MFTDFANVWSPVTLAKRLGKTPLPVRFAGENLVFFRDQQGVAHALLDRCPHRGVKLSLGKVTDDGCLRCPFHAWEFDGQGRATHIPLNPDAKKERLGATAVPTRELGGLLWVYTAPGVEAPVEPIVPEALTQPGLSRTFLEVDWNADWTRAMENMLDSPHVPFLHAATIGRFVKPLLKRDSSMHIEWEDTPYGGRTTSSIDGNPDGGAGLQFYAPNTMVLTIPVPNEVFRMHSICVPIETGRVRMIIIGARSFARLPLLNPFFNRSNAKIAAEDRAVVESSWPVVVPPANEERSVRTDKATLRFRKYYFEKLKGTSAEPRPPSGLRLVQSS
ncbi:MAG: aromatic ring-hydroxylating dioxygenase subunit alpha [Myxococcaceae bacterium]|nr:aromatic ring-hydroxylating dioxygenase subunit alpha [Myxococcaceae bacterium]